MRPTRNDGLRGLNSWRRVRAGSAPRALLLAAAVALAGCGREPQAIRPPPIHSKAGEGFVDLSFAIESREQPAGAAQRLVAVGLDRDQEVAFSITLEPGWKEGKLGGVDLTTFGGTVILGSVGPRSDHLVQAIDRIYATGLGPKTLAQQVKFTGISLAGRPDSLDSGPVKIKLFFESEVEDRYAELFLNLDVARGAVELNEKDPDYRKAVVQALAGAR
jgi:hypothetical protein